MRVPGRPAASSGRGESGQALVEFALVVPIFLILLLGIVEFARAWNIYEVLTDAAREGARRAVVDDPSITLDGVVASIQAAGNRAGITIETGDIQITGFGGARGTDATVRIEYEHELRWVGVLLSIFTGDRTVTMVSETVMRIE